MYTLTTLKLGDRLGEYFLKVTGTLKDWDVRPILHQINCPTLLLHSPTDEVHETAFMPFFTNIPKVKWVEFYHSSHIAHFEEPERYVGCIVIRNIFSLTNSEYQILFSHCGLFIVA